MTNFPAHYLDIDGRLLKLAATSGGIGAAIYAFVMAELMYPGLWFIDSGWTVGMMLFAKSAAFAICSGCIACVVLKATWRGAPNWFVVAVGLVATAISIEAAQSLFDTLLSKGFVISALIWAPGKLAPWLWAGLAVAFFLTSLSLVALNRGSRTGQFFLLAGISGMINLQPKIGFDQISNYLFDLEYTRETLVGVSIEFLIASEVLLSLGLWAAVSLLSPPKFLAWVGAVVVQVPIYFLTSYHLWLGLAGKPRGYVDYPPVFAPNAWKMSVAYFALCGAVIAFLVIFYIFRARPERTFE